MKSQVTTKRGDAGTTTALSGESYPKSHTIMECVGDVDELRAHTALARQIVLRDRTENAEDVAAFLFWLLHVYFVIGSACSDPLDRRPEYRRENLGQKHIDRLEKEQARLEDAVRLPKAFIVSASNVAAAQVDVTCTVARRLERSLVRLKEAFPDWQAREVLIFVNRLSDTLYMLARYLDGGCYVAVDYTVLD